jgi:hypothetical protein
MSIRQPRRGALSLGVLCALAGPALSCGSPPSGPTDPAVALSVLSVVPSVGSIGAPLIIVGTGFRTGATVRLGGVAAAVSGLSSSSISATAPAHSPGVVDVIVTNPGGETAAVAGAFTYVPLAVSSIETPIGFAGIQLRLTGSGFQSATVVTFDGVRATAVGITNSAMFVTIPAHAIGLVDVVATNPNGESASLKGGFTYAIPPTLTLDAASVSAGGPVRVTWAASTTWGLDWIGLFRAGAANVDWLKYIYTGGATSGTSTFTMPLEPGLYEFRYLPNDSYVDIARSSGVTVAPAQGR